MEALLYSFLDELLFVMVAEPFLAIKRVEILTFSTQQTCYIKAKWYTNRLHAALLSLPD